MADEDNDDRRGSRDNTGRDLRPNHARNNENAPTGSLGTNQVKAPSLGLGGTSTGRQNTQAGQQTQQSKGQNATQTVKEILKSLPEPMIEETSDVVEYEGERIARFIESYRDAATDPAEVSDAAQPS